MARVNTANHAFQTPAITDKFSFTGEVTTHRVTKLDAVLAGLVANDSNGGNYVADANNAGKLISAVSGSYIGRVIALAAAADASLIFQDNTGSGTGTDKHSIGYDDSRDSLALSQGATLGANGAEITSNGDLNALQHLEFRGYRLNSFVLHITNTAGVIQHRMRTQDGGSGSNNLNTKIVSPSATYQNTPSVDASTAFVGGGGIVAGGTYEFLLDTAAAQAAATLLAMFTVTQNDTGTALVIMPDIISSNINGTTLARVALWFRNATSGAAWGITTANIAAGQAVWINCQVWLA